MIEINEPVTEITFDTIAGLVKTKVYVENGVAKNIAMLGVQVSTGRPSSSTSQISARWRLISPMADSGMPLSTLTASA